MDGYSCVLLMLNNLSIQKGPKSNTYNTLPEKGPKIMHAMERLFREYLLFFIQWASKVARVTTVMQMQQG